MVSSDGWSAVPFLRVTLKEREWMGAPADDLACVWVDGLCRGGDTSPTDVILMEVESFLCVTPGTRPRNRWTKSSSAGTRPLFCCFIQQFRVEKFSLLGWKPGDPLLSGMEGVASFDGADPQINAVTSEDFLSECALQYI